MNVNRSNQINGYHRSNQIKKQNMKLSEPKKGGGHRSARVPESSGEGAGTPGRTSTGAADEGSAHTGAHSGY